ncbi:MAG: M15 family metallopeptidase, partial [Bacteroidota bacterium]
MLLRYAVYSVLLLLAFGTLTCSSAAAPTSALAEENGTDSIPPPPVDTPAVAQVLPDTLDYDTTKWAEVTALDTSIRLDIRYATENNFVGQVLYSCPRCFLRPAAARAVVAAHEELQQEGLGLKMFDCYRPRDVQWKLWEIFPQPGYVADPRTGSIHNRGAAVDLTIITAEGEELDMGTDFDFFGPRANHTFTDLPPEVLDNRRKLKALMKKHGFSAIRSE